MSTTTQTVPITSLDPDYLDLFEIGKDGKCLTKVKEVIPGDNGHHVEVLLEGGEKSRAAYSCEIKDGNEVVLRHYTQSGNEFNMAFQEISLDDFPAPIAALVAAKFADHLADVWAECLSDLGKVNFEDRQLHQLIRNHGIVQITSVSNGHLLAGEYPFKKALDLTEKLEIYMVAGTTFCVTSEIQEGDKRHTIILELQEAVEKGNVQAPPPPPQPDPPKAEKTETDPPTEEEPESPPTLPPGDASGQMKQNEAAAKAKPEITAENTKFFHSVTKNGAEGPVFTRLMPEPGEPFWVSLDGQIKEQFAYLMDEEGNRVMCGPKEPKFVVNAEGNIAQYVEKQPVAVIAAVALLVVGLLFAGIAGIVHLAQKKATPSDENQEVAQRSEEPSSEGKGETEASIFLEVKSQDCKLHHNGVNTVVTLSARINDTEWVDDAHLIVEPRWLPVEQPVIVRAEKKTQNGEQFLHVVVKLPQELEQHHVDHHVLFHADFKPLE